MSAGSGPRSSTLGAARGLGRVPAVAQQLWFLRHGEAEPHGARPDADRELTERGRGQSLGAGRAFVALELTFQDVFTSPKARALQTAELACEALGVTPVVHEPLAEGFDAREALALLRAAGEDQRVLVIGHEPDFTRTIHDLTGGDVVMKKGGVAGVRMEGPSRGVLLALLRPRELDRLGREQAG
jgi:phosphohistidine phosphatase